MKKSFVFLLAIALLSSCKNEKSGKVTSASPDEQVKVEVFGTRTFMEPWTTNIVIAGHGNNDTVVTEIYAEELSEKTVKISWKAADAADIVISQTDGNNRIFHLLINESEYKLWE